MKVDHPQSVFTKKSMQVLFLLLANLFKLIIRRKTYQNLICFSVFEMINLSHTYEKLNNCNWLLENENRTQVASKLRR